MEIKRQRKPRGLKRKRLLKGGNLKLIQEYFDNLKEDVDTYIGSIAEKLKINEDINKEEHTLFYQWALFINYISNQDKNKKEDEDIVLTVEEIENLSKSIANKIALQKAERKKELELEAKRREQDLKKRSLFKKVSEHLINLRRPFTARPFTARPATARPMTPVLGKTKRASTFLIHKNSKDNSPKKEGVKLVVSNTKKSNAVIISEFDKVFESILKNVNDNRNNKSNKGAFKTRMSIVNRIPDIDTSLPILVGKDIKDLKSRYGKIIDLIKTKCTGGFRSTICSTAASILGVEISTLYTKLKYNADNNVEITDGVLIEFINSVLPLMIKNLTDITEFEEDFDKLKNIKIDLGIKGGKKSKAVRKPANHAKPTNVAKQSKKVILGKERCIYKVKGSNKDHIKYKGTLITVADYKKLMRGLMRI
uniref:Uncharacterized protein n=1 Tax=viral metagenome TaxID=1070528 RepID=A0A6C0K9M3_9ZZZZ